VLAAWKVVLSAAFSTSDVRVATFAAGRGLPGAEQIVGLFSNLVCLRSTVHPSRTFRAVVRDVQTAIEEATANQDVPFEAVAGAMLDERGVDASRLFQVLVLWHAAPADRLDIPGLDVDLYRPTEETFSVMQNPLDLKFEVIESPTGLSGTISHRMTSLMPEEARALADGLERCLARGAARSSTTVASLRVAARRARPRHDGRRQGVTARRVM
jgi:non-ribosomal peptide synthetase component F